jgi:hypothetical protein
MLSMYSPDPRIDDIAGVTRYYDFTVARATHSPDGVTVPVIVVNGEYPGPLIEANWGDWYDKYTNMNES